MHNIDPLTDHNQYYGIQSCTLFAIPQSEIQPLLPGALATHVPSPVVRTLLIRHVVLVQASSSISFSGALLEDRWEEDCSEIRLIERRVIKETCIVARLQVYV